ncbi:MAG: LptF/LptG family permease [Candidatus Hydrogenedentes bacterium]|nr:LptF/LptG family permease [Candidatus Hydrogenedentota bacterium]
MKILDRYLLVRYLSAVTRAVLTLASLYILIDLLTTLRQDILKYDVPWRIVFEYYVASLPKMIYQIAPLAVLVSALMVLGECAQTNEVTAALAGGIGLRRFVRMPVMATLALCALIFVMEESVGARATAAASRLESHYFSKVTSAERTGRSWAGLGQGWTCHILKFNRAALTGEGVLMHAIRPDAKEQINARRIYWDPDANQWMIEDGFWQVFSPDYSKRPESSQFSQRPAPFSETPEDLFAMDDDPATKTAGALMATLRRAEGRGSPSASLWLDYYAKFSQPVVSFVMLGLAIPFALRLRRGGLAISFGMSIAIALSYLVIYGVCFSLGHVGRLSPFVAAWLANAVFLAAGTALWVRTPT